VWTYKIDCTVGHVDHVIDSVTSRARLADVGLVAIDIATAQQRRARRKLLSIQRHGERHLVLSLDRKRTKHLLVRGVKNW
jgi:hypothetical protein